MQQHWRKNEQHIHHTGHYKTHPIGSSRNKLPDGEEEKGKKGPQMDRLIYSCPLLKFEQRINGVFDVDDANAIFLSEKIATSGDIAFDPEDAQPLIQLRAFKPLRGKPDIPGSML